MRLRWSDLAQEGVISTASWDRFAWHPEYRTTLDEILDRKPFFPVEVGGRCECDDDIYSYCSRCGWRYGLLGDSESWPGGLPPFELTAALR